MRNNMGQRFHTAGGSFTFPNGAVGWRPGGPFDCVGPYAKVQACPVVVLEKREGRSVQRDTGLRRTCYATGTADTFFSVPACARVNGRHVAGFFTHDDAGGCVFVACYPLDAKPARWHDVRERYLHGSRASNGNRSALVARVEAGTWRWFAERDGRTVVTGEHGPDYRTERAARRHAEGYLTTGHVDGRNLDALPLAKES